MTRTNAEYRATVAELTRIAEDPTETPRRRRLAREALDEDTRGSGPLRATILAAPLTPRPGNHRGGHHLRAEIEYDGDGQVTR